MKHKRAPVPLYAMTCALGGQWTVVFNPDADYAAHSLTGYGEFPRGRYPGCPHVDMRTANRLDTSFYVAEEYSTFHTKSYIPLPDALKRWQDCGATITY